MRFALDVCGLIKKLPVLNPGQRFDGSWQGAQLGCFQLSRFLAERRPTRRVHGKDWSIVAEESRRDPGLALEFVEAGNLIPARELASVWLRPARVRPRFFGIGRNSPRQGTREPSLDGCSQSTQSITPITRLPDYPIQKVSP